MSSGLTVTEPDEPASKVYPSASDLATAVAPMVPPAPALFSTINGWPSAAASFSPAARAATSVAWSGVHGTMMRTGLSG